ncbi:MAG: mannitol dehydrogenase family protein [Velocimicrobium sp.]
MKLNKSGVLDNKAEWIKKDYAIPEFNIEEVIRNTKTNPEWIHFGAGNIFRAFQANVVQTLLNEGVLNKGLIVVEGYDYEIIEKINKPTDSFSILATLKANGTVEKTVVGSVVEALTADSHNETDFNRLKEIFCADSLKMVSFTITEKGYSLLNAKGELQEQVAADMINGPQMPESYMGKVAALLYERYINGQKPLAMVSMDNCSHNGDKLYAAMKEFANGWEQNGVCRRGFLSYVNDKTKVTFPWSMIDKITPRPDEKIKKILEKDKIEGLEPVITSKNTYVATFVNAEECEYLVIEDDFPNGKVELEKGGIIYTQRKTVDQVEKMKVCTCLNPLHTSLAVFGCLLGYHLIFEEMKDDTLKRLVEMIGYEEGLKVVVNPGIIDPKKFIDEVLKVRVPNPFMPDTPQRIATDTSQKLSIRFGETIKAYISSENLDVKALRGIPLVFAGWLRYLMAIDDNGRPFKLSADPLLDSVCPIVRDIKLGDKIDAHKVLKNILSERSIFGVNLYEAGLGELVEHYFTDMIKEPGAVRATIDKNI